jgi:hypothetical protein
MTTGGTEDLKMTNENIIMAKSVIPTPDGISQECLLLNTRQVIEHHDLWREEPRQFHGNLELKSVG